jgi:4-amino-4-deoxy-L-arabinose transferase-like glycosyltransferase
LNLRRPTITLVHPWLFIVFGLGLMVRLIAFANLEIINPDGVLYIYQAKAIASGQWDLLDQCQLSFFSLYPLLIAGFQWVISNWVLSAKLVSLCFGFGTLIILYRLLKLYFNAAIAQLTLLLYAMLPVLVRYSVDAMRDATFWFFFTAAIWLFVLHGQPDLKKKHSLSLLLGSSFLILLATWNRIEGIILLPVACLYLAVVNGKGRWLRLLVFLLPPIGLACIIAVVASLKGIDIFSLIRLNDVVDKFNASIDAYQHLRMQLKSIGLKANDSLLKEFLPNARNTIWLVALGTMLTNAMESFFYPYVPIFIVGAIFTIRQRDLRHAFGFLLIIIGFSFLLLYAHVLQTWIMTYRFVILLIIPACVLAGVGMEKTVDFIGRALSLPKSRSIALIAVFIVGASLVKNLSPIEHDKAVYRQISATIKQGFPEDEVVRIAGRSSTIYLWIFFYANAATPEPVCHAAFVVDARSMSQLLAQMKSQGSIFLLWEASAWKDAAFGRTLSDFQSAFDSVGHWTHEDTGDLVLLRLKASCRS